MSTLFLGGGLTLVTAAQWSPLAGPDAGLCIFLTKEKVKLWRFETGCGCRSECPSVFLSSWSALCWDACSLLWDPGSGKSLVTVWRVLWWYSSLPHQWLLWQELKSPLEISNVFLTVLLCSLTGIWGFKHLLSFDGKSLFLKLKQKRDPVSLAFCVGQQAHPWQR